MAMTNVLLSIDNPLFRTFIGYAGLVTLKTMFMSGLTAFYRITKNVYANPEDLKLILDASRKKAIVKDDQDVERVRRIHQNDVENVLPFVLIGLMYTSTNPSLYYATLHFRVFTASRFLHTLCYFFKIPQPSRFLVCSVGYLTTLSMAIQVVREAAF